MNHDRCRTKCAPAWLPVYYAPGELSAAQAALRICDRRFSFSAVKASRAASGAPGLDRLSSFCRPLRMGTTLSKVASSWSQGLSPKGGARPSSWQRLSTTDASTRPRARWTSRSEATFWINSTNERSTCERSDSYRPTTWASLVSAVKPAQRRPYHRSSTAAAVRVWPVL